MIFMLYPSSGEIKCPLYKLDQDLTDVVVPWGLKVGEKIIDKSDVKFTTWQRGGKKRA